MMTPEQFKLMNDAYISAKASIVTVGDALALIKANNDARKDGLLSRIDHRAIKIGIDKAVVEKGPWFAADVRIR